MLESLPFMRKYLRDACHDICYERVGLFDGAPWFVYEPGLNLSPPGAQLLGIGVCQ